MEHINAYLKAGNPVVAMRTATHGFAPPPDIHALATFLVQSWVDDKERLSNILPSAAAVRIVTRTEKKAARSILPRQLPLIPPTLALDRGRDRWEKVVSSLEPRE